MSTPLQSYLTYKLAGVQITDDLLNRPTCKLCENRGEQDEEMVVNESDSVYACAWWKEWSGWELFGVYHITHSLTDIVEGNPPRPTAILKGIVEKTSYRRSPKVETDAYTLADLSLVQVSYPGSLDHM